MVIPSSLISTLYAVLTNNSSSIAHLSALAGVGSQLSFHSEKLVGAGNISFMIQLTNLLAYVLIDSFAHQPCFLYSGLGFIFWIYCCKHFNFNYPCLEIYSRQVLGHHCWVTKDGVLCLLALSMILSAKAF